MALRGAAVTVRGAARDGSRCFRDGSGVSVTVPGAFRLRSGWRVARFRVQRLPAPVGFGTTLAAAFQRALDVCMRHPGRRTGSPDHRRGPKRSHGRSRPSYRRSLFGALRTARNVPRATANAHARAKRRLASRTYNACAALAFRERSRTHAWAKPCLAGPPGARTARNVPRCHPDSHMGEALFGGPTLGARTNAISRAEHFAWPPDWDGAS
jgi:hypothetical protein